MSHPSIRAIAAAAILLAIPAWSSAQQATPLPEGTIPAGVSIAGLDVSGLAAIEAKALVLNTIVAPHRAAMPLTFHGRALEIDPDAAGYAADVDTAVIAAMQAVPAPGTITTIPLVETISKSKLRDVIEWRAGQIALPARDATVSLNRAFRPVVRKAAFGYTVDVSKAVALLAPALITARPATPYALPETRVAPEVTSIGPVIVVTRGNFKLRLYKGTRRIRTYPIAVGQPAYPTPTGNFRVIEKQMNPTWFPPSSPWAAGLGPVPPGSSNPLGTRWIGTSAPGIGMHGTPNPSSIGSAASHGCIRMYISDVENLYPRVQAGTPVFIR
ncbi:MAG: L,D-transpeptidase family protein [Miltoncostaeaceae bacterium]